MDQGVLRSIGNVLRALSVSKFDWNWILLVITPSPLASVCFGILNYFVWLRITDEGSEPEIRIWSIMSIKSNLKWCIHLSRSLVVFQLLGECSFRPYRALSSVSLVSAVIVQTSSEATGSWSLPPLIVSRDSFGHQTWARFQPGGAQPALFGCR